MIMNLQKVMYYLNYILGSLFILIGSAVMMGILISSAFPSQFRWMAGIVLLLYGVFRIVYTIYKKRESSYEDDQI